MCDAGRRALRGAARRGRAGRDRPPATRAIRTRSASCAASRAAACARTTAGSTRSRASCRSLGAEHRRAASSPTAARSPTTAAATEEPPLDRRRRTVTRAAATTTSARSELPRAEAADLDAARGRPRRRRRSSSSSELRKVFKQRGPRGPRARRRQRRDLARRDARARRRVGQRQDDARADAARHRRADRRDGAARRARARRRATRSARSEELRALQIVFQNPDSALNRRHSVRRILAALAEASSRASTGAAAEARMLELAERVRLDRADAHAEAGAALRRAQAARRDRARVRGRPEARRLRRADVGARRLRAGGDPQPARRAAGARSGVAYLFISPRPRRRPLHLRPDRRALPRPRAWSSARPTSSSTGRTTRTRRRSSPRCRRSTAEGATGSGSRATSRAPPTPPVGLRLPHALPALLGADLRARQEPPLVEVEPGHLMRCHIPIEELRAAAGARQPRRPVREDHAPPSSSGRAGR